MKFNLQKFSADVKAYRSNAKLSQSELAERLDLENHTLVSLFESGKRAPSKEVFANYCKLTGYSSDDYWEKADEMSFDYLMKRIKPSDKKALKSALEKIRMREYLFALFDREYNNMSPKN